MCLIEIESKTLMLPIFILSTNRSTMRSLMLYKVNLHSFKDLLEQERLVSFV